MNGTLHIFPLAGDSDGSTHEIRARLEAPGTEPRELWFRTPEASAADMSGTADAFAVACTLYAMQNGWDMHIHAAVTEGLLENLHEFQEAWARWKPNTYRAGGIAAETEERVRSRPGNTICAFSGGLDSCFTASQHCRNGRASDCLSFAGLMVHGLDIRLDQPEVFERAAEKNRILLESLGGSLVTVATNFRELPVDWDDAHGSGVASCLQAMGARYGRALIPGTHSYDALRFPWGSNPVTDPLMSSNSLQVRYDGAGYSREQKASLVADWPQAMKLMRVCWEGTQKDRNCGACRKCVTTAMCFAAYGLPTPEAIPAPDLLTALKNLKNEPLDYYARLRLRERIAIATENGISAAWVRQARRWLKSAERKDRRVNRSG
jgi:hypothetical protein